MDSKKQTEADFEVKIQKIIDTFTKAERLGKENTKKYKDWVNDITSPNFKLISNLLNYFLDELTSTEMRENIFKIMRKFYTLNPSVVSPQISENKDFLKAIIVHINKGDKALISDNCFFLLTQLFQSGSLGIDADEEFIKAMFDGLAVAHEEDILNDIVRILIDINVNYKSNDENLFLKVHKTNENSRVLNEILLRIINNEHEDDKQIKILKCLNDLMDNQKESIFYVSDLETFIDIILSKIQITDNVELKVKLLEMIEHVSRYDEYYSGGMYKIEDITELMEEYEASDDYDEAIRKVGRQIVVNMTDRQGKKKNPDA